MAASIAVLILEASKLLHSAGVPDSRREASALMGHVLGRDRTFIISHSETQISDDQLAEYQRVVHRRSAGEPLQYITGTQEFFKLDFFVTTDVLIPRPETELLVETALDLIPKKDSPALICDVGTGSGCIAISLLSERPNAKAVAIDISPAALRVALINARKHRVVQRMEFVVSDCLGGIDANPRFDLVVSNPPYVAEQAVQGLQREVRDYEPRMALTAGSDGLLIIKRLLTDAHAVLKNGGYLLIEIGFDQRDRVLHMIDPRAWGLLDIHKDLQGVPRTVALKKIS